ncbi:VOC family protein [Luteococcus sp. H138]|uniref:VOC family protein n=1 Tax=unclassified Luteococcus TaxID=2639923 RepID=UPI00313C10D9
MLSTPTTDGEQHEPHHRKPHLGTTDLEGVKPFYQELFGWQFDDAGPDMAHYNMITKDGGLVGGAMDMTQCAEENQTEPRTAWDVFLAVDDLDERLQLALDNGATIVAPAMDAGPAGRFAIVTDPTGAVIAMWRGGDTEGYAFTGQPGTPVWFELMTQDFEKAKAFYSKVFDFNPVAMETPMEDGAQTEASTYVTNGPEAPASSGICNVAGFVPESEGSWWRIYFAVDGCDQAVETVQRLGGRLLDGPKDSPFGRIATVADPMGATFQLCSPGEAVR